MVPADINIGSNENSNKIDKPFSDNENDNQSNNNKYYTILNDWKIELEAKLQESLPNLNNDNNSASCLQAFCSSCCTVQSTSASLADAQTVLNELEKQNPDQQKQNAVIIEQAKKAVSDAEKAVQDALNTCQSIAIGLYLDNPKFGIQHLLSNDYKDDDLILYTVLCHGTVDSLATWCQDNDPQGANQLLKALQNVNLMRLFLQSGGARHGKYGNAIICYHELLLSLQSLSCYSFNHKNSNKKNVDDNDDDNDNDDDYYTNDQAVLHRLALAVALEIGADPLAYFDETAPGKTVDPIQRYVHYEQAYLLGELDPAFATFTVWELRHVINSDATNDELGWGRQCLLNYRPDMALPTFNPTMYPQDGTKWQYCYIVRSDVPYRDVDFYEGHKSYDQILSGGGKCGPRAWYGRFILKAFGIPTWGVVQPGHAALTRWTHDLGWTTCLGAGFEYSWWEDQGGIDFLLETQARSAFSYCCNNMEQEYLRKVLRLEWISQYYYKEDLSMVRMHGLPDPKSPWCTLGMMQRRRLSTSSDSGGCGGGGNSAVLSLHQPRHHRQHHMIKVQHQQKHNKITQLLALQEKLNTTSASSSSSSFVPDVLSCDYTTGVIVIPASSCTSPTQTTEKVFFLPSISGGQQLHVEQDAEIEYTLSLPPPTQSSVKSSSPSSSSSDNCQQYKLSFCVCTVHRAEQPIRISITSDSNNNNNNNKRSNNPETDYVVKMPYTVGMWQETEPVVIKVVMGGGGAFSCTKLRVIRPNQDDSKGFSFKEIRLVPV